MSEFTISAEHSLARLNATAAFANEGTGAAKVTFYDASDAVVVDVVLADPAATVTAGVLRINQAATAGDMILVDAVVTRATWVNRDGVLVASGAVTDEAGDGPFILKGSEGTTVYAGGRAVIGVTEIT